MVDQLNVPSSEELACQLGQSNWLLAVVLVLALIGAGMIVGAFLWGLLYFVNHLPSFLESIRSLG